MTTITKYDTQATEFLAKYEINLTIRSATFQTCPAWDRKTCAKNTHLHGLKYIVELAHEGRSEIQFPFWGSMNDREDRKRPTQYDVLACVGSDVNMPTDADEVVAELGDMKPSQAQATADHARKLQGFFTEAERESLAEIQ